MDIESIKRRFGIIGRSVLLNRAVEVAYQVASTDLSVLVLGESGAGKEFFPQIVHQFGTRKHGQYIAVNCGAIPEGTIDSELFGHVKGAFTGALDSRKGYFEVADGGTIFLDEVAELPMSTQARLLRVLESGEFLSVGSSKVQKTNVRIIAATNVRLERAIEEGKFREDLYYRLSTVPIYVPPLRERGEDIILLFKWFAQEFGRKYQMPVVHVDASAKQELLSYHWPGNIRQLKNVTEQISVIETTRDITGEIMRHYLPARPASSLPTVYSQEREGSVPSVAEREVIYRLLFDMRSELGNLKHLVIDMLKALDPKKRNTFMLEHADLIQAVCDSPEYEQSTHSQPSTAVVPRRAAEPVVVDSDAHVEEPDLAAVEESTIRRVLKKHNGHRREAAAELGISERTLYRKLRDYNIQS